MCVADCYFIVNILDLPFASPIASSPFTVPSIIRNNKWRTQNRSKSLKKTAFEAKGRQHMAGKVIQRLLFGRGPNRVMETACFDANVQ